MPSQPVSEEEFDLGAVSDHSSDADLETQLAEQEREAGIRAVPPFDPETTAFPVLKAAYIQVTQNYTKLRSLLRKSELRNATLQAQAMGQRSSRKNLHPTVAKYSEEINNLGRKFSVLHQPWLGFKIERFRTRPDADPYSDTRYTTSAKNEQAMRAELFDFIPGHLHTSTGFSGFEQTFTSSMQRQRATMAFTARRLVSVIFPAIPITLDTPQQRSSHPEAEHLLGKQGARKYSVLPPVLYPPGEEQSITKVFQNPALLLLGRALLFGPSSIGRAKTGGNPIAKKWKVTEITPGFIALVSILAIHTLSPDSIFQEVGTESGIQYHSLFNSFKKLIISSSQGPVQNHRLIRIYNDSIFDLAGPSHSSTPSGAIPQAEPDLFANALIALRRESDSMEPATTGTSTSMPTNYRSYYASDQDDDDDLYASHGRSRSPSPATAALRDPSPSAESQLVNAFQRALPTPIAQPTQTTSPIESAVRAEISPPPEPPILSANHPTRGRGSTARSRGRAAGSKSGGRGRGKRGEKDGGQVGSVVEGGTSSVPAIRRQTRSGAT